MLKRKHIDVAAVSPPPPPPRVPLKNRFINSDAKFKENYIIFEKQKCGKTGCQDFIVNNVHNLGNVTQMI